MKVITLTLFCIYALSVMVCAQAQPAEQQPNVIFILVDDLRWDALGCMGNPFLQTPNIDRLANEGIIFQNAFANISVCGPSRASILTGTYPQVHGVERNEQNRDPDPRLPNMGQLLQEAGYETAFIGKWHMGRKADPREGFDYWVSFPGQGVYLNPEINENGRDFVHPGYMTDILDDYAVEWLKRPHDKPFLLYLSHKAVHSNFTPAQRHRELYKDAELPELPNWQDDLSDKPEWQRAGWVWKIMRDSWLANQGKPIPEALPPGPWDPGLTGGRLRYFQTLSAVDDGVADIYRTLEETGQLDNTIIIFTSDNGFRIPGAFRINSDKRTAQDESIRIPFIVRYPPLVQPGSTTDKMVLNIDVLPTLLDLAGTPTPDYMPGRSLRPLMAGDVSADWREAFFYEYFMEKWVPGIPTVNCVRTDDWKYMTYPDITAQTDLYVGLKDMDELYNLAEDPWELHNLAEDPAYQDKLQELRAEMIRLRSEVEVGPQGPQREHADGS